jgi:putative ABC transport system permease protein
MQLGFLGATERTATLLYDRLNFDILVTSSEYLDFSRPGRVDRARLAQAAAVPGVERVLPFSTAQGLWRNPTAREDDPKRGGRRWAIVMLGVAPGDLDRVFLPADRGLFADAAERDHAAAAMARLNVVFLDRRSRPDFGDPAAMPPGTRTEFNGQIVELGGYFSLGTGFSFTGLLLANEETYSRLTGRPADTVTFGLVQLKSGTDPATAAAGLRRLLPADTLVMTRAELGALERDYWVNKTAVGKLFTFGVILALMVGAIFVYQMMAADIKKRLPEYATLKAVGYRFGFLFRVVVWQSLFLAAGGFAGGLVASLVLYRVTAAVAQLPVGMTAERLVVVAALTTAMCVGSGLVAVRKVQTADPADLF